MRALARWGITPLLAAPFGAWALGLGDIELRSALNQPFDAEIALVSATPEDLRGLSIALASRDAFETRGLDRAAFLSSLEFRIAKNATGRDVVRISSRESITEPFVTMLVEMTWPRGRLLREYTVLLDPPVLLPGPAAPAPVQPAQTRPVEPAAPRGAIDRPPPPAAPQPQPQPQPPPGISNAPAPAPRMPEVTPGTYGPVQRAETLWAIAERFRPAGVSMNQMMVAVYQSNPQAFAGNMNLLQVGAVLRIPDGAELGSVAALAATAEVQRQTDEWRGRPAQQEGRLRLLPPVEAPAPAPAPAPAVAAAPATPAAAPQPSSTAAAAGGEPAAADDRLLQVRDEQLQDLQEQLGADEPEAAEPEAAAAESAAPGVDLELESEPLFADEAAAPEPAPVVAEPEPVAPVARPTPAAASEPSLIGQIVGWLMTPLLWIALGVAALLLAAVWFVRRRRQDPEDVTGRWEALESEVDDDEVREATERMRRQVTEESFVVEEQSRPRRADFDVDFAATDAPLDAVRAERAAVTSDETLSSQTVINLDQADPVAEADFHMAYGLYDQAAELVSKALEAQPHRRDLKLKLLEVFFVWGNKDAFLQAAKALRAEGGDRPDADWDKVVIMGKQICPDEALFAAAASAGSHVDVDLEAGDSPLDLAFDDMSGGGMDLDLATSENDLPALDVESSGARRPRPASTARREQENDSLDIGERTAAGLEAALFFEDEDQDEAASATTPGMDLDSLAITQESPTIETRESRDWERATGEHPTTELLAADAPTVETPTIETAAPDAPTMETPTIETAYRAELPTVEQPALASMQTEHTAEIDLDDLGLDVEDLAGLPTDLGELPGAADDDSDTRQQRALSGDDELLSATGVTQVLRADDDDDFEQRKTAVLADEDATMLAPGYDDTLTGTEVLENRVAVDESGDTSLVRSLRKDDGSLDLNLDDLSAALQGGDTVEQPRTGFGRDIFGGNGATPIDLDVGSEVFGSDDPTGTEEVSPLDPQTMTEVGTKLDLARAYIDMGDPEGARSILEEVLDEGDPGQRREAQSLIEVLSA